MGGAGVWTQEGRVIASAVCYALTLLVAPTGRRSRGPRRRVSSRARGEQGERSQLQAGLLGPGSPEQASVSMHQSETASEQERRPRVLRSTDSGRALGAPPRARSLQGGRGAARGSSRQLRPRACPHCSVSWRQTVRVQRVGASKPPTCRAGVYGTDSVLVKKGI